YSPIFNGQGKVTRIVKYATDITRAKAMAEDLQGQIKALSNSQMTIELSLDGTIVTANDNFLSTFGYDMAEVQGQHHRMFVTPQEAASDAYLQFWSKLARGQFQSATYKRIAKGGREVWIQASYNPILDKHGRPFKVVKFATDVSETHANGKRSPASGTPLDTQAGMKNALMRQSITDAPNGMAMLDAVGTFLHVNATLCELVGSSPEALLGRRLDDFLSSGAPLLGTEEASHLQQGKTQLIQEERPLRRPDGSEIWTMLHLTRERNSSTDATAFVLQVQDISERQAAQQLKIDFIATVSHELRTPLTSIKGALGLVLANTQVDLDPKVERLVALAMKNSERLASLVNDLLDMEKLSSGQAQFRVSDQSINTLLSQAVAINQPYGTEFGVDYALELPDADIWIKADADRFHQVLSNLLSNGTKFSPRGSKVRVVCTPSEGSVRVGIIDAGPGVPENFKNKI
ncbi:MAG: PAS domain S-box protein, partial [Pseudomonadota bacterium]|nr:PAS domain S-box protein [Pseudomonadota bacterium]